LENILLWLCALCKLKLIVLNGLYCPVVVLIFVVPYLRLLKIMLLIGA